MRRMTRVRTTIVIAMVMFCLVIIQRHGSINDYGYSAENIHVWMQGNGHHGVGRKLLRLLSGSKISICKEPWTIEVREHSQPFLLPQTETLYECRGFERPREKQMGEKRRANDLEFDIVHKISTQSRC